MAKEFRTGLLNILAHRKPLRESYDIKKSIFATLLQPKGYQFGGIDVLSYKRTL
jgi:hypothetical protein